MVSGVAVLLLTAFWSSVAVDRGAFFYTTPSLRRITPPKLSGRRRRKCFVSPFYGAPNDHDDVDGDPLRVRSPAVRPKAILWSDSSEIVEPQTIPGELLPFPRVPTLDASGLLPRSAYYCHASNDIADTKPTCRLQIAWDLLPPSFTSMMDFTSEDRAEMVSAMQDAVDHGFTTFQMKSYAHSESNRLQDYLYQSFLKDTPKSIVNERCQIVVPLRIQDFVATTPGQATISSLSVRTAITTQLDRLQSDSLDNVQISFQQPMVVPSDIPQLDDDRFYLDLFCELQELQRAGYIRSFSTKDMSSDFYVNAMQLAGFHTLISSNVMDANLCRIHPLLQQHQYYRRRNTGTTKTSPPVHVPFSVAANPLAGGWLTDRYVLRGSQKVGGASKSFSSHPDWFVKLSASEKANWKTNIVRLESIGNELAPSEPPSFRSTWEMYQTHVMTPLQDIARKHDVSTASIALRWLLQSKQKSEKTERENFCPLLASTVVSCRLLPEHFCWDRPYTHPSKRLQQLRDVVRFELDEEDMERLWNLSGGNTHEYTSGETDATWLSSGEERMEASSTGLFLPKRR